MAKTSFDALLQQFRHTIANCRQLYLAAGRECVEQYPLLISEPPGEFLKRMDDLHKGLLVKIYVSVAEADRQWSIAERRMAEVLFRHLWQRSLTGAPLREATRRISQQSQELDWYSLVRPFDQIAPLRNRISELETVVMRTANLVAKADGAPKAAELRMLQSIQQELNRHLRPIPLDEPGQHEAAHVLGPEAVRGIRADAQAVRRQCDLPADAAPPEPAKSADELLQEALARLDELIGLDNVKQQVRTLTNFLKLQQERKRLGLPETKVSLHMVFMGNPGTGKTTVARIVGQILGAMGILKKGHLVETDRSGLVASYAGQTGPKTHERVDEALDGVLFIDEAYSLVSEGREDAYGHEAVQALLKRMEDDRDRLMLILAGYPAPMERLLKSNPGLSSRFNTKLFFEDYTPSELGRIFQLMCDKNHYRCPGPMQTRLLLGLRWLYEHRDEHFGNGRLVRNTFENAIRRLANRIANVTPLTKEVLTLFDPDDIDLPGCTPELWEELLGQPWQFRVGCAGCGKESTIPPTYLGRRVECKQCGHQFRANWGAPLSAKRELDTDIAPARGVE